MALRTPLSVTPHLYMGDSTGRPLDNGVVYFGEQDKDPEFYPIDLYSNDELTKMLAQPVHTKGGYLYDKGDMVEPHAKELIYSVKVLDSYGRKVFYKGAMMRNSWNDDVIEQINTAVIGSADVARQVATDITNDAINNTAVEGGVLADTLVTVTANEIGTVARTQRDVNNQVLNLKDFGKPVGDDWTNVIHAAIDANTGRDIFVSKGVHKLRLDYKSIDNIKSVSFYGEQGTVIELITGSNDTAAFLVDKVGTLSFRDIHFTTKLVSERRTLFRLNSMVRVDDFILKGCHFDSSFAFVYGSGSTWRTLDGLWGIGKLEVSGNTTDNALYDIYKTGNIPIKEGHVYNNKIHNLNSVFFSSSVANGVTNEQALLNHGEFYIYNNTVTTDADHWSFSSGTYLSIAVVEGRRSVVQGNSMDGVKSLNKTSLTLTYASTREVDMSDNVVTNIATLGVGSSMVIFHFKGEAVGNPRLKQVRNNSFTVDRVWAASLGGDLIPYSLYSIGITNGSHVRMEGNIVDVPTLLGGFRSRARSFEFIGNEVTCDALIPLVVGDTFRLFDVQANDDSGPIVVTDESVKGTKLTLRKNKLRMGTCVGGFTYLASTANPYELFDFSDNDLDHKLITGGVALLTGVCSVKANITKNIVLGSLTRIYNVCIFKDAHISGNSYDAKGTGSELWLQELLHSRGNLHLSERFAGKLKSGKATKLPLFYPSADATQMYLTKPHKYTLVYEVKYYGGGSYKSTRAFVDVEYTAGDEFLLKGTGADDVAFTDVAGGAKFAGTLKSYTDMQNTTSPLIVYISAGTNRQIFIGGLEPNEVIIEVKIEKINFSYT